MNTENRRGWEGPALGEAPKAGLNTLPLRSSLFGCLECRCRKGYGGLTVDEGANTGASVKSGRRFSVFARRVAC